MSEINNNSQYNYNISLDPPNTGTQGTKEGGVEATKKGEVTITDKLNEATMLLSATFDKLGKMTIYMASENPNLPTPAITSLQINSALKPADSSGRGNPFLSPIPFVQVTVALLKLHSIMRESNLGMAAFENSIMALSMSLARTEADLIISAADKEAKMMIMEMVSSGMAILGALAQGYGAAKGLKSAAKAKMNKTSEEVDVAKKNGEPALKNLSDAKSNLSIKNENLKKFDAAEVDVANATKARDTALQNKKLAQEDFEKTNVQTHSTKDVEAAKLKNAKADKELDIANKNFEVAQDNMKVTKADIKKTGLDLDDSAKTGENGPRQRLKEDIKNQQDNVVHDAEIKVQHSKDDIKAKQTAYNNAQQDYTAESQMETAKFTAISQLFTQSGSIIKSGLNSVFVGQKAQVEADIKMTSAQREILNRTMDSLDKSMQKGGDVMSSLIQALEKLANDHVNASSMTRN